jgi:ABC-type Mn2+/Zn2+ transport system ATPase subunit
MRDAMKENSAEVISEELENQPVIKAEQLTLGYGRRAVLHEVEMEIYRGQFWSFLGPNGEGKTTFIKALLGALRPMHGRIFFRKDFARRTRIGFVPQENELNPSAPTSVREFILTGLVGLAVDGRQARKRLLRLVELLGLEKLQGRSLWELSGGQRQRAMVARALVRDPLVLIVDEPTAGLDLAAAASVMETMTSLSRDHGITVVSVTHDLHSAAERSSHAALFRRGRVVSGDLKSVFTGDNLSDTYGIPIEVSFTDEGRPRIQRAGGAAVSSTPEEGQA